MISTIREREELWKRFTRAEEYSPGILDQYERFPYYASEEREILEPSVSKYLFERGSKWEWPDDCSFAVCLTHDIDIIYKSAPSKGLAAASSLLKGDLNQTISNIRQMSSRKFPYCNFQEIMDLEDRYGARSSFYFLALAQGERDYAYDVHDIKDELRGINDAGWEVGLHGGHNAYYDLETIKAEKRRLESALGHPVIGYRNHYLRFKVPDTWHHLSRAGFKYDTTLGYADCIGFRNGMCHPFRPYDVERDLEIDILEIPLTIMDCTLDQYMRLDASTAWDMIRQLIDTVKRYNGVITILWHNTYMQGERLKSYERILKYCREGGAWMTSGEEIINTMFNIIP